jgi:hypothetical protein
MAWSVQLQLDDGGENTPSAADLERALSGIQYPKSKEALVKYVSQKLPTVRQRRF